ncbi:LacI family DNA-binding transcriptional regulator [Dryocola sp. BD626]|uniref:LacI family DNA-binding transcriptional regulator n=1 Tax=Dryocola sp. BD626 TaxID=3133273 RepID=UPI003F4FC98B
MKGSLKIKEIAKETGLSTSTVSRVLSGQGKTSEQARQKVIACASAQGIFESLLSERVLFNHLTIFAPHRAFDVRTDLFYHAIISTITAQLAERDVHIRFHGMTEVNSDLPGFMKALLTPPNEAAILIGIDDPLVHEIAANAQKPCVMINAYNPHMILDSISPDHRTIGYYSADYLIKAGHTRIVSLLCLPRDTLFQRLQGIRAAFSDNHLAFDERQHLCAAEDFSMEEGKRAMEHILANTQKDLMPTAMLCGGDFLAYGVIDVLQKYGISVPKQMSVMSMDGANLLHRGDTKLTAVYVPREELGRESVRQLQLRAMQPDAPVYNIQLGSRMILGNSVQQHRAI